MPAWVPRWMTASAAETGSSGVQEQQQQQQQAELGGASSTSSRGDPPRKRAAGPRFDTLPEFRAVHAQPAEPALPDDPTQRVEALKDSRFGPLFVRYSLWIGGAAVAYTYLAGFRAMAKKNEQMWTNTFRQRVLILGPLMSMYMTGSGFVPLPFRSAVEQWLGRPAVSLGDIDKVERAAKQAKKAAAAAAAQRAAEEFADQHATRA